MTPAAALAALRTAVVSITGLSDAGVVIYGRQDSPRPAVSHVRLYPISDIDHGLPHRTDDLGAVRQHRRMSVQIDALGRDAQVLPQLLAGLWSSSPATRALWAAGVSVVDGSAVQDITAVLQSGYEPRTATTVVIAYELTITAVPAAAATAITVDLTGTGLPGDDIEIVDVAVIDLT